MTQQHPGVTFTITYNMFKELSLWQIWLMLKVQKSIFHNLKVEYWWPDYFCLRQNSRSITPLVKTGESSLCVCLSGGRVDLILLLPPAGSSPHAPVYSRTHLLLFFPRLACSAALVAISNTSLTPSFVFAEHSMYPKAPILLAISRPSSGFTGSCRKGRTERLLGKPTADVRGKKGCKKLTGTKKLIDGWLKQLIFSLISPDQWPAGQKLENPILFK